MAARSGPHTGIPVDQNRPEASCILSEYDLKAGGLVISNESAGIRLR